MRLEWYELSRAALVGVSRHVEALRLGCQRRVGSSDEWSVHVLGACGECAFAKATGRYWSGGVSTFKSAADVGESIEIRTRSNHHYDLIVRDDDRDESAFVLVTGGPQEFYVGGWIYGADAKRPEFRANHGNHGAAYFVPHHALRPLEELRGVQ